MKASQLQYFTLRPAGTDAYAKASRAALAAFAKSIAKTDPKLKRDINNWIETELEINLNN